MKGKKKNHPRGEDSVAALSRTRSVSGLVVVGLTMFVDKLLGVYREMYSIGVDPICLIGYFFSLVERSWV